MIFRVAEFLETLLFANRKATAGLFAALSLVLLYFATQLKVDAGFTKQIPLAHPYMQTFTKHGAEFGGANRVMIAVAARDGKDLFTPQKGE
jgi:predicted RND superfamily exporter protein